MGIVKGLKDLNKALDKPQSTGGSESKARWVKLEDGESVKMPKRDRNYYDLLE